MGRNNIYTMGIPEREERGTESLFKEILAKNIPNMGIDMDMKLRGPQTGTTPKGLHLDTSNCQKSKMRILKATGKKTVVKYKQTSRLSDFSAETLHRDWYEVSKY